MAQTKLEKLVADMAPFRDHRNLSIKDVSLNYVAKQIVSLKDEEIQLRAAFHESLDLLNYKIMKFHIAAKIAFGQVGFLSCNQDYDIESGFTCFPEIMKDIKLDHITLSLSEPPERFGKKIFKIDDRGMLTFQSHLVDSSD